MDNESPICPKCRSRCGDAGDADGWSDLICSQCNCTFRMLKGTVRAKRSRGNKKLNSRIFSVRVRFASSEEFVEFSQSSYDDFELRSGDSVRFCFIENAVFVVENSTIAQVRFTRKTIRDAMQAVARLFGSQ